MRTKFSIIDLMLMTFGSAVVLLWYQTDMPPSPEYDDFLLRYHRPVIPQEFADNGRDAPSKQVGFPRSEDYRDGSDLFIVNHQAEWHRVAIHFVRDRYFWRDDFPSYAESEKLLNGRWTKAHVLFARNKGRDAAVAQIDQLIARYGERQLQAKLLSIPWYREYVEMVWPILCTFIFCVGLASRFLIGFGRRKRQSHSVD